MRIRKEGLEGEYIRLNKKDLIDRLDSLYQMRMQESNSKFDWVEEIDTDAFKFHTKEGKVWYFGNEWLGRPKEVWID